MKIPYPMVAAVKNEQRHAQMGEALKYGFPRLRKHPIDDSRSLSIACYGPSLADTWQTMTRPIMSMSGSLKFLVERGVTPDFHCDMDPRKHKVQHIDPPVLGVKYLMASVCHPKTWDVLKDQDVTIWHCISDREQTVPWVERHDPHHEVLHGQPVYHVIIGNSTIGLTALQVGGFLGFRHFEIHGMDGSSRDGHRHAGPHFGHAQGGFTWDAGGVTYQTSRIMSNAVAETQNMLKSYPIFCVFHGDGLTQALLREWDLPNACRADETKKAGTIRTAHALFVDMPRFNLKETHSYWDVILATPDPRWLTEVLTIRREAAPRRETAKYNTGTVGVETALLLRAVCAYYKPKVVAEVGTFIGTSTLALQASEHLYTCDRSNDCLPSSPARTCFPYQSSTDMLRRIQADGRQVDLFFFDGRIQPEDLPLIHALSHKKTVYLFDDYVGKEKGIVNVALLYSTLPRHVLSEPYSAFDGRTTLAALVPVVSQS